MNKTSSKQAFRSISKQNGGMYCKKDIEIFTFFCIYKTRSFEFRRMTSCHPWALASKMASKMADKII